MNKGELNLRKWCFKFGIIPIYHKAQGYIFHFGIFKLIKYPPEGEMIRKAHYKGFWLRKEINWQGFEITF